MYQHFHGMFWIHIQGRTNLNIYIEVEGISFIRNINRHLPGYTSSHHIT